MAADETLKVLRTAIQLEVFTQPILTMNSEVSYETVKRVLRAEQDRGTVEQLDETVSSAKRQPPEWRVTDRVAIQARLDSSRDETGGGAETSSTPGEVSIMYSPLEAALSAAEDRLVFALHAGDPGDAAGFAGDALAELEPFREDLKTDDRDRRIGRKRNLPTPVGRADVVYGIAAYLVSTEVRGPLWGQAFDAVRTFDNAPQAGLHKMFLAALIELADQRALGYSIPAAHQDR